MCIPNIPDLSLHQSVLLLPQKDYSYTPSWGITQASGASHKPQHCRASHKPHITCVPKCNMMQLHAQLSSNHLAVVEMEYHLPYQQTGWPTTVYAACSTPPMAVSPIEPVLPSFRINDNQHMHARYCAVPCRALHQHQPCASNWPGPVLAASISQPQSQLSIKTLSRCKAYGLQSQKWAFTRYNNQPCTC